MHPDFETLHAAFVAEVAGLSPSVLRAHPDNDPARWSISQIVDHLSLTYGLTAGSLSDRLEKGRVTQARVTPKQWIVQRCVLTCGYMPPGCVSPRQVWPGDTSENCDSAELLARMRSGLASLDEKLVLCEDKFGSRPVLSHHILGPIGVNQWRKFHLVHGMHHLRQIRRLSAGTATQ